MKTKNNQKKNKISKIAIILLIISIILAVVLSLNRSKREETIAQNTSGDVVNKVEIQDENKNKIEITNKEQENIKNNNNQAEESKDYKNEDETKEEIKTENKTEIKNNEKVESATNKEFVTERVETIPEKVLSEEYFVSWKQVKLGEVLNEEISLQKANILAEAKVLKVTENGLEENPEVVKVGEILQYEITLTNKSTKTDGIVNVTDAIPEGTEFISATESNLQTEPQEYEKPKEVKELKWKNIKVKANDKVTLLTRVKVTEKTSKNEHTTMVENTVIIQDGTKMERDTIVLETKVANIFAKQESKAIYNEEKPHVHESTSDVNTLHEQDIIEYTITLTNVGEGAGVVEVTDDIPEGTTIIENGTVTVKDKNGTKEHEIEELNEGIDVVVDEAEKKSGVATLTFNVIVNSFSEENKTIINDTAKMDGNAINSTVDNAEKVYIDINAERKVENIENDAAKENIIDSVNLQVKNGDVVVDEKQVTEEENWENTFNKIPKYDSNGNEINYTVIEVANNSEEQKILEKYYDSKTKYKNNLSSIDATITDTFKPTTVQDEKKEITVQKIWENIENDAAEDNEISSITIEVKANDEIIETQEITGPDWTHTFDELKKYDSDGNEIIYTIDETITYPEEQENLEKYNKETIEKEDGTTVTIYTFDTEKVQEEKTQIEVQKEWANIESDAAKDYEISNIAVQLKLDDKVVEEQEVVGPKWKYTFTNLKKYDENGNKLVYTVDEVAANAEDEEKLEKYNKEIKENQDGTIIITNTFAPEKVQEEKTQIKVEKQWANMESDAAQKYKVSSVTLQVRVYATDGNYALAAIKEVTEQNWSHTFTDLKKYDIKGNKIEYVIDEVASKDEDIEKFNMYDKEITTSKDGTVVVTNAFNPSKVQEEKTQIKVQKVWENMESDAAKDYEISNITLQVKQNKKVVAEQEMVSPNWSYTFTDLKKYDVNGNELSYTVDEIATNTEDEEKLAKYDKEITTKQDGTIVITNTFNISKIQNDKAQISVTINWEDTLNRYNTRPDEVTIAVNGTSYIVTGEANTEKWTFEINDLPKYDSQGNKITYTATEENVPERYTKIYENELTITNKANIIVEKTAHKANADGTIGREATNEDIFKAEETLYYKLIFKNPGSTLVDTKILIDPLPARLELVEVDGVAISEYSIKVADDEEDESWEISQNENGGTVIEWTINNVKAGEQRVLIIKLKIAEDAIYKDLCEKTGEDTQYKATLYVRKDGKVPYEGSGTSYESKYYTGAVGTVSLTTDKLFYDTEANLKNNDIYYVIKNNNKITEMVSNGITREQLEQALADNGVILQPDEAVAWYVIKEESDGFHIDGVIRKISELSTIENDVYMDNEKQDSVIIKLETEIQEK